MKELDLLAEIDPDTFTDATYILYGYCIYIETEMALTIPLFVSAGFT